jgi:hypothetical protein
MSNALSFNEDSFLASPELVAGLLAWLGNSRTNRRSRTTRDLPDWLGQLLASPDPVAQDNAPVAAPVRIAMDQPKPCGPEVGKRRSWRGAVAARCGECPQCLENTRWDRIINEKFADPAYCGSLRIRHSSTQASV